MGDPLAFTTTDGFLLEGERRRPTPGVAPRVAAVLCHPHPSFGGSMRSLVISPLFTELPNLGVDCLRFNFRGVEGSQGVFGEGIAERLDVDAAIATHRTQVDSAIPLVIIGFSFGADLTLATDDARIAGWCAIACPLRFCTDDEIAARADDARPKAIILGALDDFRDPQYVAAKFATAQNSVVTTIPGASHFFVGRDAPMIAAVSEFLNRVAPAAE